jgi:hypothetical protein
MKDECLSLKRSELILKPTKFFPRRRGNNMPMVKGKKASTRKGFSKNIETEMKAGKPQKQAVAIAYSEADRGKRRKK